MSSQEEKLHFFQALTASIFMTRQPEIMRASATLASGKRFRNSLWYSNTFLRMISPSASGCFWHTQLVEIFSPNNFFSSSIEDHQLSRQTSGEDCPDVGRRLSGRNHLRPGD